MTQTAPITTGPTKWWTNAFLHNENTKKAALPCAAAAHGAGLDYLLMNPRLWITKSTYSSWITIFTLF